MGIKKKRFSQSDHLAAKPLRLHAWVSTDMTDLHHQESLATGQIHSLQAVTIGEKLLIVWTQKC